MKIGTAKTEVIYLSRNPYQCLSQVSGTTLTQVEKFKYLGIAFTSNEGQDKELNTRIGKAVAVKQSPLLRILQLRFEAVTRLS